MANEGAGARAGAAVGSTDAASVVESLAWGSQARAGVGSGEDEMAPARQAMAAAMKALAGGVVDYLVVAAAGVAA